MAPQGTGDRVNVVVCVPWIESNCPHRTRARTWTADYWASLDVPVVYGLDDSRPVNRSRARNNASLAVDAEVLFFADADMWVPEAQFWQACWKAQDSGRMVLAYTEHTRLSKWSTSRVLDGSMTLQGQTIRGTPSGAFAITRELLGIVGGHDERFTGWGFEDRAFQYACDTIAGPGERIAGPSYHLFHPRGRDQIQTTPERRVGLLLAQRYKRAAGVVTRAGILPATRDAALNREAMLRLLHEPGGPLAADVTPDVISFNGQQDTRTIP